MPKIEIDYSNTIIYKIFCKDSNVTDVYVGHTTNFVQRKYAHKQGCINNKSPNYKCKLYEVIRNNNGWDNWHMEIVNFFNCKDQYEARNKEQEYFILLNATLNSIEPLPKTKNILIKNNILNLEQNESNKIDIQTSSLFHCNKCEFKCSKKRDYERHILTQKHISRENSNNIIKNEKKYECNCGKYFSHRQGLYVHRKSCKNNNDIDTVTFLSVEHDYGENNNKNNKELKEYALELIKKNVELINVINNILP